MLATLIDKPFDDKGWVFEIKWDGYRALAYKNRHVILLSRNQKSFNERFGHIVDDLKRLPGSFIVDGEIVILDKKGRSQFQALQNYQREKELFPVYYVFDLLFINGRDVRSLPLLERKTILKKLLRQGRTSHIQYSDHIAQKA